MFQELYSHDMSVNALTHKGDSIEKCIATPVKVGNPVNGSELNTFGIWDTGATNSAITKKTAKELGLMPVSIAKVHGVHGAQYVNVYMVKVTLNNQNITLNTLVSECEYLNTEKGGEAGLLIGMNIITKGDFCISNHGGTTVMTFRVPSLERIDYVDEISEHNRLLKIHNAWMRTGNSKCPCGSGKQYKNCHGNSKYS